MFESIADFLEPVDLQAISGDTGYKEGQIGKLVNAYEEEFPQLDEADIVIVGCAEQRGGALLHPSTAADVVRGEFYSLYYWHQDIKLADLGNVKNRQVLYRHLCSPEGCLT